MKNIFLPSHPRPFTYDMMFYCISPPTDILGSLSSCQYRIACAAKRYSMSYGIIGVFNMPPRLAFKFFLMNNWWHNDLYFVLSRGYSINICNARRSFSYTLISLTVTNLEWWTVFFFVFVANRFSIEWKFSFISGKCRLTLNIFSIASYFPKISFLNLP